MGIILHKEDAFIREHLMEGMVGLELESLRTDREGNLSKKPHPFPDNPVIDRDFGEAQIEIGTAPEASLDKAVDDLRKYLGITQARLKETGELLWPFSNPPVIRSEEDIKVADFRGERRKKTLYREYLAGKYGKYKMSFSGIHFNYSFSPELISRNYMLDSAGELRKYTDHFYLNLAQRVLEYSWMIVALLGASPVVDSSFYIKGLSGKTIFTGKSSLRCSESGYWNTFVPYIDYGSIEGYSDSIRSYVRNGMLNSESELYYPVRIKNAGEYSLERLEETGADHIELRMIDLNPFSDFGIDQRDAAFLKLFLIWLSAMETDPMDAAGQVQAIQNIKAAAAYDLDITKIFLMNGKGLSVRAALESCLIEMIRFFEMDYPEAGKVLYFQMEKLKNEKNRYADRVLNCFGDQYIERGVKRAEEIQEAMYV